MSSGLKRVLIHHSSWQGVFLFGQPGQDPSSLERTPVVLVGWGC